MIELLSSFETLYTPRGIAICGAYSKSDGKRPLSVCLEEMAEKIKDLKYISYQTDSGNYQNLVVEDIEFTTSIGDGINLFLLLGHISLPSDFTPEKTIYRGIAQPQGSTSSSSNFTNLTQIKN